MPLARTPAWSVLIVEAGRKAIMLDPAWNNGNYTSVPANGVRLWRATCSASQRRVAPSGIGTSSRVCSTSCMVARAGGCRAERLRSQRLHLSSWAYETHDVGATPGMNGDYVKALASIKAKTLIMTGIKDLLNPEWEALEAARHIPDVRAVTINPDSVTGHMAAGGFRPADVEQINAEVAKFLDIVTQRGDRPR